jgi:hypothetical protein
LGVGLSGWWSYPLETSLWIVLTAPLHIWFSRYFLLPVSTQIEHKEVKGLSLSWKLILLTGSILFALVSVILVVKIYTEYPWKMVFELLISINSG